MLDAGLYICIKVPLFESTVESAQGSGARSHLQIDHARLKVEASTLSKAVLLTKFLDESQPSCELRVLKHERAPQAKEKGKSLKWMLNPQVK